jgi:hypothetical protein
MLDFKPLDFRAIPARQASHTSHEARLLTQATTRKLEALSEGESLIFTSGPGQTTTATRLPNGELDYRLNPTPERPGLNLFA